MEKEQAKLIKIEVTGTFRSVYHVYAFDEEDAINVVNGQRTSNYKKQQSYSSSIESVKQIE